MRVNIPFLIKINFVLIYVLLIYICQFEFCLLMKLKIIERLMKNNCCTFCMHDFCFVNCFLFSTKAFSFFKSIMGYAEEFFSPIYEAVRNLFNLCLEMKFFVVLEIAP